MTTFLVLTIIGDDQPGLVEALSATVAENGGNWLESSMSQLAGKFAGVLRVSVSDADTDRLIEQLHDLSDRLKLVIERVSDAPPAGASQSVTLKLMGNDRPGIVQEITSKLAALAVNVEQLNSECTTAPMSAAMLFTANARLTIPSDLTLESLQQELEQLADDVMVELELD